MERLARMEAEAPAPPAPESAREGQRPPAKPETRLAAAFLAALPGLLVVYFAFNAGGYFPGAVGFAATLLLQMLILRILVAEDPFDGATRSFALVAGALTAFAAWTLASQLWSNAHARALVEFDRAFLYLLVLVLCGIVPAGRRRVRWTVRCLLAGIFFVCAAALVTRALPHVWPVASNLANNRLSYPLTYWNALGILATCGALLAIGLTTDAREPRTGRILAAAALPVLATTLFFTFSRGAIVALLVGLVGYLVLARSSAIVGGILASVPPAAVAVVVAYHAGLLATLDPTTPAAVSEGKRVAAVVAGATLAAALARWALIGLDRRLAGARSLAPPRRVRWIGGAVAVGIAVAVVLAANVPSWVGREYHAFVRGAPTTTTDLRTRLADPSSNGRTEHWRVGISAFDAHPIRGDGAGTYEFTWEKQRRLPSNVVDGHSLYVETLAELGVVGLVALAATLLGILASLARRARASRGTAFAALFAASLAWAVHAGVDWDWEMPAVSAWVFAAGGLALAARRPRETARPPSSRVRIAIAVALLVSAITPALMAISQHRLEQSASAFERGDCTAASRMALSSIDVLAIRPEPYQILGYCDLRAGRPHDAVAAMAKAVHEQPGDWQYHYGLAVARASASLDPRREIALANRLNPRESLARSARALFDETTSRSRWSRIAEQAEVAATSSGRLTLR
jgi:O-antigen ligase